jgi:hypothetical protein
MIASMPGSCSRTSTTRVQLRSDFELSVATTSVTLTSCKSHLVDYCAILTCFRALKNYYESPLLKLPQELLDNVYEYVFDDQVLQIMVINGQLRLVNATNARPFGLPSTSRQLLQDTGDFPYTKTTFKIVTFKFISLLDNWQLPIMSHKDEVLDALNSIPEGINIARFEIVGVMKGSDGIEAMDTGKAQGFKPTVDYKAELEKEILGLFPEAEIVFRAVDNIDQL